MKTTLGSFEGRKVDAGQLKLTGKADDKIGTFDYDEEVFMLVKGRVKKITHGEGKDGKATVFVREHTVDGERMLDEAAMLADEQFGVHSLWGPGDKEADPETGEIPPGEPEAE